MISGLMNLLSSDFEQFAPGLTLGKYICVFV